jgi:hypothetical protein
VRFLLVVLLGCILPLPSLAEPPELLVPITDSERTIVEANNPYFLPAETYFAKQYRIVRVDTELLLNAKQIRITLFDGQSVTLETVDVEAGSKALDIAWEGRYLEPYYISVDELVAGGMDRKAAESVLPDLNRVRIFVSQVSFDESTRVKYSHLFPRFQRFRTSGAPLYDVTFVLQRFGGIELRSLASDPEHHVLIEYDPEKVFPLPSEPLEPGDARAALFENPENLRKGQQYRDFLESLGPDPRSPDFHKE